VALNTVPINPSGHRQSRNEELLEGLIVLIGHAVLSPSSQKKSGGHVVQIVSVSGVHAVDMYFPEGHRLHPAHVLESNDVALIAGTRAMIMQKS
jgi:hypothetical protein